MLVEMRSQHEKGNKTAGLNVFTGKVVDMWKEGVVEPLRVKTQAISSGTEAATMILRIDDVLSSKSAPAGGMPPGGMGGMGEWAEWAEWIKAGISRSLFLVILMDILDTSSHSKEELVRFLSKELDNNPILMLTGPQGGGKTTLAIKLLSENVGAYFEGRGRAAQPVVLIRKDLVEKMKEELYEKRKLPIYEGDEPVYVDVSVYDQIRLLVENIFDVMELGEPELIKQITLLTKKMGVVPKAIELVASDEELIKRRLARHLDAKERLTTLIEKEKKYGIESNLWGIQGAKITDIINREGVTDYDEDQISRTIKDFDRIIPTKDMTLVGLSSNDDRNIK